MTDWRDDTVERVLRGLREVEGAPGMEARVLDAVSEEALALKAAGRGWDRAWKPPFRAWGVGAARGLTRKQEAPGRSLGGWVLAGAMLVIVVMTVGVWRGSRMQTRAAMRRVASLRGGDGASAVPVVAGRPVGGSLARAEEGVEWGRSRPEQHGTAQVGAEVGRTGECLLNRDTLGCRSGMQTSGAKASFGLGGEMARLKPCPSEGGVLPHVAGGRAGLYDSGSLPGGMRLAPCAFESGSLPARPMPPNRLAAVSVPAPPMPLSEQERLLLELARAHDPTEMALLDGEARTARETVETARFESFFRPVVRERPVLVVEFKASDSLPGGLIQKY